MLWPVANYDNNDKYKILFNTVASFPEKFIKFQLRLTTVKCFPDNKVSIAWCIMPRRPTDSTNEQCCDMAAGNNLF